MVDMQTLVASGSRRFVSHQV